MANETRVLAKFAADLREEDVPVHVRRLATNLLVDQLGCAIGGVKTPWGAQVRATVSRAGGVPDATVIYFGDKLPAGSAALINSTFGHSYEYDDLNGLAHGHPGAELIPALLAIAEREHICGRDFLTALVVAYEVRGCIGWAVSPDLFEIGGPQFSTSCGPFGAAVGVARLLGLDADGIHNALGIAGTFSGGLMQYDQGGGSVKRIFTGVGASSGIQSAELARAGMTGPEGILEGARGLLRIYTRAYKPERLLPHAAGKWIFERIQFKPYCCCGIIHPSIDGLKKIISEQKLTADDIASITIRNPSGFHDHATITAPHDMLGMQFSTSYSLALTALRGGNTPREYTLDALADPAIKAFASRVTVEEGTELNKICEGHFSAHIKVCTNSGAVHEQLVIDAKGSVAVPLTDEDIDNKFRSQAEEHLGSANCEALLRMLRDIDGIPDVGKLFTLLAAKEIAEPGTAQT